MLTLLLVWLVLVIRFEGTIRAASGFRIVVGYPGLTRDNLNGSTRRAAVFYYSATDSPALWTDKAKLLSCRASERKVFLVIAPG